MTHDNDHLKLALKHPWVASPEEEMQSTSRNAHASAGFPPVKERDLHFKD